jgi:hypothetical protein
MTLQSILLSLFVQFHLFPRLLAGEAALVPRLAQATALAGQRLATKAMARAGAAGKPRLPEPIRDSGFILCPRRARARVCPRRARARDQKGRSFLCRHGVAVRRHAHHACRCPHDLELCAIARPVLHCWRHRLVLDVGALRCPRSYRTPDWSAMIASSQ